MCSCGRNHTSFRETVVKVGSILPSLKYMHCAYKDQFEAVFRNVGIDATEDKLPLLASLYDNQRGDIRGDIKDANGQPIRFDTEFLLSKIDVNRPVNTSCNI